MSLCNSLSHEERERELLECWSTDTGESTESSAIFREVLDDTVIVIGA